ncbi:MAG: UDP-2,4-diacetamido-2,4,6-trideoxy-beta-L-altropyranose hydrolase [Dongiaceae bacterium]
MKNVGPIVFRIGGGKQVGLGHLRRCLSLAEALRRLATECLFLLDGDATCVDQTTAAGFEAIRIRPGEDLSQTLEQCRKRKARAIVADSYALDTAYLASLHEAKAVVAAVDDLADRELPVDLVINGSVNANQLVYRAGKTTRFLLGTQYILLRSEFAEEPKRTIAEQVRRVLVTVGGGDPQQLTPKLVRWAAEALKDASVDVVIGPMFDDQSSSELTPTATAVHLNPRNIRNIMLDADLALCGGGQTTYELAATGTPAVAIRLADNQTQNLAGLNSAGALVWAGDVHDADLEVKTNRALAVLAGDPARRAALSQRGRALVDGQGATRVARAILELTTIEHS